MLVTKEYNRSNALAYARRWALDRNPLFFSFNGIGGDCTNFVSQSIFAGGCVMNYTPVYGWYYISSADRTPSWSGVEFFYDFIVNNREQGPFGHEADRSEMMPGDIIQLANDEGDYYHSLIITDILDDGEILIAAHSDDYLDRPLSNYNYTTARFIHIDGIRFETQIKDACFRTLIEGGIEPFEE